MAYATVATLAEVTLQKSLDYLTSLDNTKKKIEDLYPAEGATGYTDADWEEITSQTQPGKSVIPTLSSDGDEYDLTKGVSFLRTSVLADFPVKIKGAQAVDGTVVEITIYLPQGSTPRNIDSLSIDGADATQLKITGTPEANVTNTFTIKAIYFGAVWKATVAVG